ncbi:MAG: DNA repair protein RecO [Candidatus Melainabacteria bacterium RIFCSPLOWO2_02_FULL_35_15]|nr:MAG: DNA repair protein RecO [Candidatus Melainabacteria bacterium RIFCSPLOWO2_02_FULL_35_15]
MPTYNDYGIILNSYDLGESDRILNIYTKENGLVRAVVKGARKTLSKFSGKVDQLSCCYFHFASGKNLDTVCDCEQVNSFSLLRSNLICLTSAVLFLEIVSNFAHEDEHDSHHIYDLLYVSLNRLQISPNPDLESISFISKFLSLHGYKPQFETCVSCAAKTDLKPALSGSYPYSSILGGILCSNCSGTINSKSVNSQTLNILLNAGRDIPIEQLYNKQSLNNQNKNIRSVLELLREHLDVRAKNKIKSFDLVFSL